MKRSGNTIVLLNFLPSTDSSYAGRGSVYPSIGIMLIGSTLKKYEFNVKIIDGGYDFNYLNKLKDMLIEDGRDIVFVGMSVMTTQVPFALTVSKNIKKVNQKIPVVWGGPHPTLFPEQTLEDKNIDIISINEGGLTAVNIAKALQKGQDLERINGIGYRNNRNEIVITERSSLDTIDDLPNLDFSLIEMDNYLNPKQSVYEREFPAFQGKVKTVPILTGLGCPFKCQFCINVILKRHYRFREAGFIVEEIKRLQAKYNANTFIFMDEDFFINKRRVLEFISLVEKENLHFNWRMWCRVDHFKDTYLNRDILNRMNRIGHGSLVMGGESGNQETLDRLKKGITTDQILNSLYLLNGTNIFSRYSFMVGLENESLKQIRQTFNFCFKIKKIRPDVDIAGPFLFRLYPGSPIYNRLVEKYSLYIPQSTESWEIYLNREGSLNLMPWTPKKFQENLKYIQFYSEFAMPSMSKIKRLKDVFVTILAIISRFRIRHFIFSFPVDYLLINWYFKQNKSKNHYNKGAVVSTP